VTILHRIVLLDTCGTGVSAAAMVLFAQSSPQIFP